MAFYDDILPYDLESTDWIMDLLNPRKRDREAMIFHHTGDSSLGSTQKMLGARGLLGYDYFIDRDGNLVRNPNIPEGGFGQHMRPGQGPGLGLSNRNTIGVGLVGQDEDDLTQAQLRTAQAFAAVRGHKPGSVFGHGEVNPHKDPREGSRVAEAIRDLRPQSAPPEATSEYTTQADLNRGREPLPEDTERINRNYAGLMGGSQMDLLDGLAPRQQGGGLLGLLGNPMAQAHIAQILKGLSPYSSLDPDAMLARAQKDELTRIAQARDDFYRQQQLGFQERTQSRAERGEQRDIEDRLRQQRDKDGMLKFLGGGGYNDPARLSEALTQFPDAPASLRTQVQNHLQTLEQQQKTARDLEAKRAFAEKEFGKGTPGYNEFIGVKGKSGLSAGDRAAVRKAEDELGAMNANLRALEEAKELNYKTYYGLAPSWRGTIGSALTVGEPSEANYATQRYEQIVNQEAIERMSRTMKGATTDYEFRQWLARAANLSLNPKVREQALSEAIRLYKDEVNVQKTRMEQLRGGDYYEPGGGAYGSRAGDGSKSGAESDPFGWRK